MHKKASAIANHLVGVLGDTYARLTTPRVDDQFGFARTAQACNGLERFDNYLGGLVALRKQQKGKWNKWLGTIK